MSDNHHLTAKGFLDILNLCYFMNNTSTRSPESLKLIIDTIKSSSPLLYIKNQRQKMNTSITLEYLAGLIDGDGSFWFHFRGHDYNVLIALMDYFGCGEVKKYTNKDACVYRIHSYYKSTRKNSTSTTINSPKYGETVLC